MKSLSIILLLLIISLPGFTQIVSYDDFKSLIPYLQKEDWKNAYEQSGKLLKGTEKDTSDYRAIVVYINIFSGAGLVSIGEMTHEKLLNAVKKYEGQKIKMSAHPVTDNAGALNQTLFTINDTINEAFTSAGNGAGTSIFCFEKFTFNNPLDPADFSKGVNIRCSGVLQKVEANPNKSKIWILRLTVKDAYAVSMTPR